MQTKICQMLNIKYPIIQGGMQWLGIAELAGAVSNAGALGIINARSQMSPEDLAKEIRKTRAITDQPFAVNISMLPDTGDDDTTGDYFQAAVDEGMKILETSGRSPQEYMDMLKKAGVTLIHKVASVRHALKAQQLGADIVEIVGFECGGHPGLDDVSTSALIPKAADMLNVPIIAGGGIADGRGLVAALSWGAQGVVMGSRFVASIECPIHEAFKKWIVNARETDTAMIMYAIRNPLRAMANNAAREVLALEDKGAHLSQYMPIISGENTRQSYQEGDLEGAPFPIGQGIGIINDIKPVKDIIEDIVSQARTIVKRLDQLIAT